MKTRMIALMAALGMIASFSTACIGTMGVSGKVREFNLETVDGRWEREFLFLGLYIIPVYPFAGMADLLVVNSIEFWTGTNPVNDKPAVTPGAAQDDLQSSNTFTTDDGSVVTMTHELDDSITATVVSPEGDSRTLSLVRSAHGITLEDEQGNVLIDTATQHVSPALSEIL